MDERFPGFDGWTVTKSDRADGRHEFLFRKAHPAGKDGYLTVWASIGADGDPMIAYLAGRRDASAEDVRVAPPDDLALWQGRFNAANREVIAAKVRRGLAKGLGNQYAIDRLSAAGFSLTEIVAIVEGK